MMTDGKQDSDINRLMETAVKAAQDPEVRAGAPLIQVANETTDAIRARWTKLAGGELPSERYKRERINSENSGITHFLKSTYATQEKKHRFIANAQQRIEAIRTEKAYGVMRLPPLNPGEPSAGMIHADENPGRMAEIYLDRPGTVIEPRDQGFALIDPVTRREYVIDKAMMDKASKASPDRDPYTVLAFLDVDANKNTIIDLTQTARPPLQKIGEEGPLYVGLGSEQSPIVQLGEATSNIKLSVRNGSAKLREPVVIRVPESQLTDAQLKINGRREDKHGEFIGGLRFGNNIEIDLGLPHTFSQDFTKEEQQNNQVHMYSARLEVGKVDGRTVPVPLGGGEVISAPTLSYGSSYFDASGEIMQDIEAALRLPDRVPSAPDRGHAPIRMDPQPEIAPRNAPRRGPAR